MYVYTNGTTRKPRLLSPLAKKAMNGDSMPAPAPCDNATVAAASVGPSTRSRGSAGNAGPSESSSRIIPWDCTTGRLNGAVRNDRGGLTMAELDREQIAANWTSRGFSCELWTDPPGQRWEDFRHATDELVTVLEGEMEFEVAGKVLHPQVGEELLIPAATLPSQRTTGRPPAYPLHGQP